MAKNKFYGKLIKFYLKFHLNWPNGTLIGATVFAFRPHLVDRPRYSTATPCKPFYTKLIFIEIVHSEQWMCYLKNANGLPSSFPALVMRLSNFILFYVIHANFLLNFKLYQNIVNSDETNTQTFPSRASLKWTSRKCTKPMTETLSLFKWKFDVSASNH